MDDPIEYPAASHEPTGSRLHGRWVADPYRWLEDAASARTQAWLAAQERLLVGRRRRWTARARCAELLDGLTSFVHESPPRAAGGRLFSTRRSPEAEHPCLVVEEDGHLRTLLDPSTLDPSGRTVLGCWSVSPDGAWVACQLGRDGREELELVVLDAATGAPVGPPVPDVRYSDIGWAAGCTAFYYARCTPVGEELRLHGVDSSDRPVRGPAGAHRPQLGVRTSADGRWLVVSISEGVSSTSTLHVADLAGGAPDVPRFRAVPGLEDGWTEAWPTPEGRLFLLTDAGTGRDRLATWDATAPDDAPRTLVEAPDEAEADGAVLASFVVLRPAAPSPYVALVHWSAGTRSRLTRHRLDDGARTDEVPLPGPGCPAELTAAVGLGPDAWFTYSDRTTPDSVWHYDDATRTVVPWRAPPVARRPATDATAGTAFRRLGARVADGAVVDLFVTEPAGSAGRPLPTLVEAYGAFGESQVVEHYAAASAWALLGGRHVVACVRGGGERGEAWHRAGSREHKQRGVDDLVEVVEHLVAKGLAAPGRVASYGVSAGGLLTATVVTQRPDLLAAAVCVAPLTDMVRFERSGLGAFWAEEFGTADDPDELGWLTTCSPYHRVRPGVAYPHVLLCASEDDTRVDPAHARKLCAALQEATSGGEVLLRTERGVGHGERDRTSRLALFADVLAACWAGVATGWTGVGEGSS